MGGARRVVLSHGEAAVGRGGMGSRAALSRRASPGTLRERFVQDTTVRGFTDKTRHDYIRTVADFAASLERSPSTATAEDIRRFQIHQFQRGMNAPAMNRAVAAYASSSTIARSRPVDHVLIVQTRRLPACRVKHANPPEPGPETQVLVHPISTVPSPPTVHGREVCQWSRSMVPPSPAHLRQ